MSECELSQTQFLQAGGTLARALLAKQKSGEHTKGYVYHEYPKDLHISKGIKKIECSTEDVKGRTVHWTEEREEIETITVASEEEEERVLSGGKTSTQLEADRQALVQRCRSQGILTDPTWSAVRLRRELGDKLDAPEPADEMAALQEKLGRLQEIARLKAEIARLTASTEAPVDEPDDLRAQLLALGVTADKRWGAARLREELDKATAPDREAA